jgi:hypothetical protein
MSWEEKATPISDQVKGLPREQQHLGTHNPLAGPAPAEGISQKGLARKHKSQQGRQGLAAANLASSTYRTHSYYNIDTSPSYWQLPLPTWKLFELDDAPLPAPKKRRCWKKKKPQPVEHKHLHTTFFQDPLCPDHR